MQKSVLIGSILLGSTAVLLGQLTAHAGDEGDGGVAGGGTDCATAPAAVLGNNAFDTSSATASLNVAAGTGCSAHTIYKVNYFTFTATEAGSYTFATCGLASWDTRLALLNVCGSGLVPVTCNDDACNLQSSMTATLVAGTTYRLVVGGYGSTNGGAGSIAISFGGSGGGGGGGGGGGIGPDVIVGAIPDITKYGSVVVNGRTMMAYAIGTTSCNIGDALLDWFASPDNRHPFIPMNMYRIKGGRLAQVGVSWGKHGFTALQGTLCGTCQASSSGNWLGIGCSDPYSASLNGGQGGLGTRTEVNAATGYFPGTYNSGMPAAPTTIGRRLQVDGNDLNPSVNAGATYFVEGHYVHPGDAAAGNDNNNASYRAVTVGSLSSGAYTLTLSGPTVQQQPALYAWRVADPNVTITPVDVANDGRFLVGFVARDNGNGTWRYEYAVHNLNSHRSGNSFSVPIPAGVNVTNIGFKDIDYHSGDAYDPTNWSSSVSGGAITWTGGNYATNQNGNALRFATLYNFWFDADEAPGTASASIGLFRPGTGTDPNSVSLTFAAPAAPAGNPADLNGDGLVNAADLAALLGAWGGTSGAADINGDGTVGAADLSILLGSWTN
ncbi:MAG: dockerin type I domain-containing protein [Planctomycetota bacterium]